MPRLAQVADALELELVSITLNPRGTLYKDSTLLRSTIASGNHEAMQIFQKKLAAQPWVVYRVRRVYAAKEDKSGRELPDRKGNAKRAVEHSSAPVSRSRRKLSFSERPTHSVLHSEKQGVIYLYLQKTGDTFPTREEYFVAGPAVVEEKARYGLEWFEEQ